VRGPLPGADAALEAELDARPTLPPDQFAALYAESCQSASHFGWKPSASPAVMAVPDAGLRPSGAFYLTAVSKRGLREYELVAATPIGYGATPPSKAANAGNAAGAGAAASQDAAGLLLQLLGGGGGGAVARTTLDAVKVDVRALAAELLGSEIGDDVPLMEAGLDSLAGAQAAPTCPVYFP